MKRYTVTFGTSVAVFYSHWHTEQFCRALALNGTEYSVAIAKTTNA